MFIVCLAIVLYLMGAPAPPLIKFIGGQGTPMIGNSTAQQTNMTSSGSKFLDLNTFGQGVYTRLTSLDLGTLTLTGAALLAAAIGVYALGFSAMFIIAAFIAILALPYMMLPVGDLICAGQNIAVANPCIDPIIGIPILALLNLWGILAFISAIKDI
jgi:hypothetical protein